MLSLGHSAAGREERVSPCLLGALEKEKWKTEAGGRAPRSQGIRWSGIIFFYRSGSEWNPGNCLLCELCKFYLNSRCLFYWLAFLEGVFRVQHPPLRPSRILINICFVFSGHPRLEALAFGDLHFRLLSSPDGFFCSRLCLPEPASRRELSTPRARRKLPTGRRDARAANPPLTRRMQETRAGVTRVLTVQREARKRTPPPRTDAAPRCS